ncbi:unnamed protein product [Polarella glacialis]|uniref:Uncharacterized protein n=1 Tax=Polarella glacialis TaxID=89957 RepID=A0A813G104_POLGL|nr:unnamed protein product [Polarella glacialis]
MAPRASSPLMATAPYVSPEALQKIKLARQNKLTALRARVAAVRTDCEASRATVASAAERVQDAERLVKAAELRLQKLESDLHEVESRVRTAAVQEDQAQARWTSEEQPALESEGGHLNKVRHAWRQRLTEQRRRVAAMEHELNELEEDGLRGLKERRRMQGECLSLQQECEDAKVDLQGVQELLTGGSAAVKRMVKQRLDLEWEMETSVQQQAMLHRASQQSMHASVTEADTDKRKVQEATLSAQHLLQRHRVEAERHRGAAASLQHEAAATGRECRELEKAVEAASVEAARAGQSVEDADREAHDDRLREAAAREMLEQSRARRMALERHCAELQGLCQSIAQESLELQDEHARLLMGRARRKAYDSLQRSRNGEATVTKPPTGTLSPEMGFYGPAGAAGSPVARGQRHPILISGHR